MWLDFTVSSTGINLILNFYGFPFTFIFKAGKGYLFFFYAICTRGIALFYERLQIITVREINEINHTHHYFRSGNFGLVQA